MITFGGSKGACSDLSVYNTMCVTAQLAYLCRSTCIQIEFQKKSQIVQYRSNFWYIIYNPTGYIIIMLGSYFIGSGVNATAIQLTSEISGVRSK